MVWRSSRSRSRSNSPRREERGSREERPARSRSPPAAKRRSRSGSPPKMYSIVVREMPMETTESDLKRKFAKYGEVGDAFMPYVNRRDAIIKRHGYTYGFVRFMKEEDQVDCVKQCKREPMTMQGREVRVGIAHTEPGPAGAVRRRSPPRGGRRFNDDRGYGGGGGRRYDDRGPPRRYDDRRPRYDDRGPPPRRDDRRDDYRRQDDRRRYDDRPRR